MECRPFDRGKQLVLSGALQIPAEGDAAQIRIHQVRCGLRCPRSCGAGQFVLRDTSPSLGSMFPHRARPRGDRAEDVPHGGESGFNSRALRMHAALHYAANTRHQVHRRSDPDDAGRGAHDVDHVIGSAARADGVPMRVECSDRNRNARLEPQFFGPKGRQLCRRSDRTWRIRHEFCAHSLARRDPPLTRNSLRRKPTQLPDSTSICAPWRKRCA